MIVFKSLRYIEVVSNATLGEIWPQSYLPGGWGKLRRYGKQQEDQIVHTIADYEYNGPGGLVAYNVRACAL
jgi:hypothetical protein